MKILSLNFLTCAVKACKSSPASFPLHFKDVELEQVEMEYNPQFIRNIMPRVEWDALRQMCQELGLPSLPTSPPTDLTTTTSSSDDDNQTLKDLHTLLLETTIQSGSLVCGNCGHEYKVKEGIANFLLPSHLV